MMSFTTIFRSMLLGLGLALSWAPAIAQEPPRDTHAAQDFDELWSTVAAHYAYFDEKQTDWNCVRSRYRPLAVQAQTLEEFNAVLASVLHELYDRHTVLRDQEEGTQRAPYYDMLVEKADTGARVVATFAGGSAEAAGLSVGDMIVAVNGRDIGALTAELMPRCLVEFDPDAEAYALNTAVSGIRGQPRLLRVISPEGSAREVSLPLSSGEDAPDFETRTLEGGIGYIAIRSFADETIVTRFDAALETFRDAPGLIIDVRDNGGGDTAVARPIMGRFITERAPYALMRRREAAGLSDPWTEYVEPRGPFTFDAPVVVLTNHWSASMAEGFPMGMRNLGRATIVGTAMMRLGAGVFQVRLDRTGIDAQYSGEPVYDTKGTPREDLEPDVITGPGADILEAGIVQLRREIAARKR